MSRSLYVLKSNGSIAGSGPGWVYYADIQHTEGSKQAILGGTRTLYSVDGLGATTEVSFATTLDPTTAWASNTISPEAVGESYSVRIGFKVSPTVTGEGSIDLQLDVGSGTEVNVYESRFQLQKGSGVTHFISDGFPIFCLSTFNANGGKLYITPSINVDVWDRTIFLQRTFSP